jgi:hypothetical protein
MIVSSIWIKNPEMRKWPSSRRWGRELVGPTLLCICHWHHRSSTCCPHLRAVCKTNVKVRNLKSTWSDVSIARKIQRKNSRQTADGYESVEKSCYQEARRSLSPWWNHLLDLVCQHYTSRNLEQVVWADLMCCYNILYTDGRKSSSISYYFHSISIYKAYIIFQKSNHLKFD